MNLWRRFVTVHAFFFSWRIFIMADICSCMESIVFIFWSNCLFISACPNVKASKRSPAESKEFPPFKSVAAALACSAALTPLSHFPPFKSAAAAVACSAAFCSCKSPAQVLRHFSATWIESLYFRSSSCSFFAFSF